MITVDVPRAVAWTRVARGRRKSQDFIRVFSIPRKWLFFFGYHDLAFSRPNWDRCNQSNQCDGGPRVRR